MWRAPWSGGLRSAEANVESMMPGDNAFQWANQWHEQFGDRPFLPPAIQFRLGAYVEIKLSANALFLPAREIFQCSAGKC